MLQKTLIFTALCLMFIGCTKDEAVEVETSMVSFSIIDNDVSQSGMLGDEEVVAKSRLKNNTDRDINIKWKRTVKAIPKTWETAVCDTNACYFPGIDSASFILPANGSARMWAYFYPQNSSGTGYVEITVLDAENPNESQVVKYTAEI